MKVRVSAELCTGHGRCWTLAPEVFDSDDEGLNAARGSIVEVAEGSEGEASAAVSSCPEGALEEIDE